MGLYLVHCFYTMFPDDENITPELGSHSKFVIANSKAEAIEKLKQHIISKNKEGSKRDDVLDITTHEGMYILFDDFEAMERKAIF